MMDNDKPPSIVTVINHVDALNLGDASLLYMTVSFVKQVFHPQEIYVLSFNLDHDLSLINLINDSNVKFLDAPARPFKGSKINKMTQLFEMLNLIALSIRLRSNAHRKARLIEDHRVLQVLMRSELIIASGGDNISDKYGVVPLMNQLYNIVLAIILRKKIIMFGNSLGPFKKKVLEKLVFYLLRKLDHVVVRDMKSEEMLRNGGIDNRRIHFIPDLAFDLPVVEDTTYDHFFEASNTSFIGIGVSALFSMYVGRDKFTDFIACLCDDIVTHHDAKIIFVSHVLSNFNDEVLSQEIVAKMKNRESATVVREINPMKIKYIISKLDLLISFRMHPLIHALSMGVPVIGIDYNDKTIGLMKIFDKEKWTLRMNCLWKLNDLVEEFFNKREQNKDFYELKKIRISDDYIKLLENLHY